MFTRDTFHGWFFHGLGTHSAARCGTRPGDFDDDEFSAIAREMTRQRLGVCCRACGGQRLEDSLPHTHGMCSVADDRRGGTGAVHTTIGHVDAVREDGLSSSPSSFHFHYAC